MFKFHCNNCSHSQESDSYEPQSYVENRIKCYPLADSRVKKAMEIVNIKMQKMCNGGDFESHVNFNYILRQLSLLEKKALIPFDIETIKLTKNKVLSLAKRPHSQNGKKAINAICMTLIKMNSKYSA